MRGVLGKHWPRPAHRSNPAAICIAGLSLCAAVAFPWGAAFAAELGPEWESLTTQQSKIVFLAPGLEGKRVRRLRNSSRERRTAIEIAIWTGPEARHAKARVLRVETWPGYHFRSRRDPKVVVGSGDMFKGKDLEFGDLERLGNALGIADHRRFSFGNVECIAFSQYWGDSGSDRSSVGTNWLQGYYCADPGKPLTSSFVTAIIRSLGIVGVAVPDSPPKPEPGVPLTVRLVRPGEAEQVFSGRIVLEGGKWKSTFDLLLSWPFGNCRGASEVESGQYGRTPYVSGVWQASCADGQVASGKYHSGEPYRGEGSGRLGDDAQINFSYGE